ncbi:hypothetical protein INT45_005358 [Circinella minor]|uniref:Uncharacterized protein n=1 Tax=Circinella minor TaxID=1195481 RepID=A0A8H7S0X1_9FUNG|nr:hypothetical protein INT45_005358 [Circinella minor]
MGSPVQLPTTSTQTNTIKSSYSSKKRIAMQLALGCAFGFLLICSLGIDTVLKKDFSSAASCASDLQLCEVPPVTVPETIIISTSDEEVTKPFTIDNNNKKIKKDFPYTIVTASSANHLCSLENFLYSLDELRDQVESFPRIVVYNIGMNRTQLPVLDQLVDNGLIDDLHTFDYFKYPRFWDVAINAGEYAWKTGIVAEAAEKYDGVLVWLDAGNMVTADFLTNAPNLVKDHGGFWSPRSSYRMSRWTHPGMLDYFGESMDEYGKYANCNGAAVGFDVANATIKANIVDEWLECGLRKRCIAPPGSSRLNHRQDQAVLTYLAYKNGFKCTRNPSKYYGLQIHRDVSCAANLLELEVQNKLHHPSAVDYTKWQRSDTLELYNHPEWRYPEDQVPEHLVQLMQSR